MRARQGWWWACGLWFSVALAGCGAAPEDEALTTKTGPLTTTLTPTADTTVRSGSFANTNFGSATDLRADLEDAGVFDQAYLRFSIGAVGTISRARLRLFVTNGSSNGADVATVASTTWSETTTTFNNRPATGAILGSIIQAAAGSFVEVDVTAAVGPSREVSFALVPRSTDGLFVSSKEASSNRPQLIIETGVTVLTPTADTTVRSGSFANSNFGTATDLRADTEDGGVFDQAYLRFSIGPVGTIARARLRLFVINASSNSANVAAVASTTWGETTTTFNNRPATGTIIASIIQSTAGTFVEADVTSAVGPSREVSFALVPRSSDGFFVNSREAASNRPELVIETGPPPPPPPPPIGQGQWSAVLTWPAEAVHAHALPNGKVLLFPHGQDAGLGVNIWDPVMNVFTAAPNMRSNVGCSGHAFLPDGRLFVSGGEPPQAIGGGVGIIQTNIFDFRTNVWTAGPNMNAGRWYPNNVALANGEMLVAGGDIDPTVGSNRIPQVLTTSGSFRTLSNANRALPSYSMMHLAPDGRVFIVGPERHTLFLSTAGTGAYSAIVASYDIFRSYGSSVVYDDGRFLVVGGGNPPTAGAVAINLNDAAPAWRSAGQMAFARRHLNATLLPDGTVLITGGTSGSGFNNPNTPVLPAEIWNPATSTFTRVASMQVPRLYHSVALLLPDGRVVSSGGKGTGDQVGEERKDAQIYSPDYLFRGPRPTITSAPATVSYGQTFLVGTPDGASIVRATWIRLPSVTHAFDQNQRFNRLAVAPTAGGVNVTAPSNRNLCPPGHYMLFLLNGNGVPSVARIVQIQ